jgi:hypothetical protein
MIAEMSEGMTDKSYHRCRACGLWRTSAPDPNCRAESDRPKAPCEPRQSLIDAGFDPGARRLLEEE